MLFNGVAQPNQLVAHLLERSLRQRLRNIAIAVVFDENLLLTESQCNPRVVEVTPEFLSLAKESRVVLVKS